MTLLSFSDYLPLGDLVKIIVVVMAVSVIAPSAVSLAVVGLDKRTRGSQTAGAAMVAAGGAVLLVLVVLGIYALTDR